MGHPRCRLSRAICPRWRAISWPSRRSLLDRICARCWGTLALRSPAYWRQSKKCFCTYDIISIATQHDLVGMHLSKTINDRGTHQFRWSWANLTQICVFPEPPIPYNTNLSWFCLRMRRSLSRLLCNSCLMSLLPVKFGFSIWDTIKCSFSMCSSSPWRISLTLVTNAL